MRFATVALRAEQHQGRRRRDTVHAAVIRRKMYFAVNVSDEHDVQSQMFRPTITDMQHKYRGNCYDIHLIQNQYR